MKDIHDLTSKLIPDARRQTLAANARAPRGKYLYTDIQLNASEFRRHIDAYYVNVHFVVNPKLAIYNTQNQKKVVWWW